MSESDIEFPFSHTGEFTITTGLAGAPTPHVQRAGQGEVAVAGVSAASATAGVA